MSTSDRSVGKEELQTWLAPSDEDSVSDSDLRRLLHGSADAILATSRKAMVFALALLKDVYAEDADVELWLTRQRSEFGGLTAVDLFRSGRAEEVEALLVRLWNTRRAHPLRRTTYMRRSPTT